MSHAVTAHVADREVRLAEFETMRAEIAQRSSLQHALVALNLTAIASLFGLVTQGASESLTLLVSVVSPTLGILWLDHDRNIQLLARYVRVELWAWEPSWESRRAALRDGDARFEDLSFFAAIGVIFGVAPCVALILGVLGSAKGAEVIFLFVTGAVLTMLFIALYFRAIRRIRADARRSPAD